MILMAIIFSFAVNKNAIAEIPSDKDNGVHLILDAFKYNNILPNHFRKTTDLAVVKDNKDLDLKGLDKLNISGSQQFSGDNIQLLIKSIDASLPITVLDLRQECHGFINEAAVSFADARNNANVGLTRDQVIAKENKDLKSIKLMVDYFMEFIKNKPKDSWLHFHCKEGIGRTSTFYDNVRYD